MKRISHREATDFFRRIAGERELEKTLRKAVKVLADANIPHFVIGGYSVQEHGYNRSTGDVDVVVPNVTEANWELSKNGFKRTQGGGLMTVTDRENGVPIDLLPGGESSSPNTISYPLPTVVSSTPQIVTLPVLLTLKLSSYSSNGIKRVKDYADAVQLIEINELPRNYPVHKSVLQLYQKIWDELHAH